MASPRLGADYFRQYGPGGAGDYEKTWRDFTFDPAAVLGLYRELFGGKPATMLDLGAANGALMKAFLAKGVDAIGIEKSEYIRDRIKSRELKGRIIPGDAHETLRSLEGQRFDLVVECSAQYLPRKSLRPYLKEVHKACGRMCCLLVDFKVPGREAHNSVTVFEPRAFWKAEMLRAGFKHIPGGEGYFYTPE